MTIYNEHELRAMASKMREQIEDVGLPDRVHRKLNEFIAMIEGAADGKVSEEALQAAVDEVDFLLECDADRRRKMEEVSLLVDQAIEEDDPGLWRDAMLRWLPLLPETHVRVLMGNYSDLLDTAEAMQALDLVEMPAATEVRQ